MSSFSRATKSPPLAAAIFAAVHGKSARCLRVMSLLRLNDDPLLHSRLRCHREHGSKELGNLRRQRDHNFHDSFIMFDEQNDFCAHILRDDEASDDNSPSGLLSILTEVVSTSTTLSNMMVPKQMKSENIAQIFWAIFRFLRLEVHTVQH